MDGPNSAGGAAEVHLSVPDALAAMQDAVRSGQMLKVCELAAMHVLGI